MSIYGRNNPEPRDHLVLGLDVDSWPEAEEIISDTCENIGAYKLNSLGHVHGWKESINRVMELGALAVVDLKSSDTPDTVRRTTRYMTSIGAGLITVNGTEDSRILRAAVEGRDQGRQDIEHPIYKDRRELFGRILASTVLTSTSEERIQKLYGQSVRGRVLDATREVAKAGVDGVVCSADEVLDIRSNPDFEKLLIAVGSITTTWTKRPPEHKRSGTPKQAIEDGADLLFLGRRISQPERNEGRVRKAAAAEVNRDIAKVVYRRDNQNSNLARRARKRTVASTGDTG